MMLPNKTITYSESVISKFPLVLKFLQNQKSVKAEILYEKLKNQFQSIHIFVQTLDCLFALGKIKFSDDMEIALC
ncbi:ABC-three component system middle component 7 [uncultured Treponema sp.]|uniref:ABC-three component system middle component 7 n=1 Tax=uncultured Treponema sp. TaxID=162155 RepID=UPI002583735D|nr:ABC-three component system middle component 7 [uncultured Treponema sp.]